MLIQFPEQKLNTYNDNYDWVSTALSGQGENEFIKSSRFSGSDNYVPEGQSLWYQILNQGRSRSFVQLILIVNPVIHVALLIHHFQRKVVFYQFLLNDTDSRANCLGTV